MVANMTDKNANGVTLGHYVHQIRKITFVGWNTASQEYRNLIEKEWRTFKE